MKWFVSVYVVFFTIISTNYGHKNVRIPPSTTDFFPDIKDNLTKLTWAHAVNNARYLDDVLKSDNTMMIEADIVLGTLIDDPTATVQPVMGHPPSNTSDLSLEQFLHTIDQSNRESDRTMKGVKLDFKSIDVYEMSLGTVESLYKLVEYPIWINADILRGPIDSGTTPVDAKRFLRASKLFPSAMLSVGWTTQYGGDMTYGSYSDRQIAEMIATLRNNEVQHSVTFPLRAGLAANSLTQITQLLSETTGLNSTLTIWSSAGDYVDVDKLKQVIYTCGLDRVFLDVPEELYERLHL